MQSLKAKAPWSDNGVQSKPQEKPKKESLSPKLQSLPTGLRTLDDLLPPEQTQLFVDKTKIQPFALKGLQQPRSTPLTGKPLSGEPGMQSLNAKTPWSDNGVQSKPQEKPKKESLSTKLQSLPTGLRTLDDLLPPEETRLFAHEDWMYPFALKGLTQPKSTPLTRKPQAPAAPSPYWNTKCEMDVDINGHDFNFLPKKNVGKAKVEGFVDGPLNHNGWFWVRNNKSDNFILEVKCGTNNKRDNDLHVRIQIKDGKAKVEGKVEGKDVLASAKVTGKGTSAKPFSLSFKDKDGSTHTVRWCKD